MTATAAAAHACWVWITPGSALLCAALYLALAHIATAGLLRSSNRDLASCWAEARSMAGIVVNACCIPGAGLCLAASALWAQELQDYDPVVKLLTAFVVVFGSMAVQCCTAGGVLLLVHGTCSAGCSGGNAVVPSLCGIAAGIAVGLLLFGLEVGCFFSIHFLHEVAVPAAKAQAGSLTRFFRRGVADDAAGEAGAGGGGEDAASASDSSSVHSAAEAV